MSFWTLGDITLCDECALEATNMGIVDHADTYNRDPLLFQTMPEAAAILSALLATIGESLGITSRPHGTCDECGKHSHEEVNV